MRLGLARHFQIPHDRFQLVDGDGFMDWARWYDTTEVRSRPVPLAGEDWDVCYCSDLPRARFTAGYLYRGPIETTPLLREVPFSGFLPRRARLPLLLWQGTSRLGWWLNHGSQSENRRQTLERIAAFTLLLKERHARGQRILIVSHGFYMQYFGKELKRAGFRGKVPMRPRGGIIYPFELR
jgi:broad specificity phosphatase PhoE